MEVDNEVLVVPCYYTGPPGLEIIHPTAGESDLSITAIQEGGIMAYNGSFENPLEEAISGESD